MRLALQSAMKPGPGESPVSGHGAFRDSCRFRYFLDAQSPVKLQFNHAGHFFIERRELAQRFIQSDQVDIPTVVRRVDTLQGNAALFAAPLDPILGPGMVGEDASNGAGRGAKKVSTIFSGRTTGAAETNVCFVNQRRRLQRVLRAFGGKQSLGECPQLLIDEWKQLVGGEPIALIGADQQARHVRLGHAIPQMIHVAATMRNCRLLSPKIPIQAGVCEMGIVSKCTRSEGPQHISICSDSQVGNTRDSTTG